ncbi:MAG: pantetheine-phosphate adenylyltransferase [Treponema sp.]|jgi:pantetheine-phosphate adenylyltransferase|nr:pantetheine-phosphate adenylyltransferase [Treponema sp.]
MLRAAFPGSFDPPTLGHINIIQRAARIFDELVVIVAENPNKNYLFTAAERISAMQALVDGQKNVRVALCTGLIVDFLEQQRIPLLLRGVRGEGDFAYEFEISMMNKALNRSIETVFMTTDPEYTVIRSSAIKEVASFGGDVSAMVPPLVSEALKRKFAARQIDKTDTSC